jgi:hypothetical protein
MKKTILPLLIAVGLIGSASAATITITDQTINQSFTITNFYSNNAVIDFARQLNAGDFISLSWTESNQQLISNSTTNNFVTTNQYTDQRDWYASYNALYYYPHQEYNWGWTSSITPQGISDSSYASLQAASSTFSFNYTKNFVLNSPVSKETPYSINTIFDYRIDSFYDFQQHRILNPPINGINWGSGYWHSYTVSSTDTIWSQAITIVPEPSTYALFGLGALALVVAYRRKVA